MSAVRAVAALGLAGAALVLVAIVVFNLNAREEPVREGPAACGGIPGKEEEEEEDGLKARAFFKAQAAIDPVARIRSCFAPDPDKRRPDDMREALELALAMLKSPTTTAEHKRFAAEHALESLLALERFDEALALSDLADGFADAEARKEIAKLVAAKETGLAAVAATVRSLSERQGQVRALEVIALASPRLKCVESSAREAQSRCLVDIVNSLSTRLPLSDDGEFRLALSAVATAQKSVDLGDWCDAHHLQSALACLDDALNSATDEWCPRASLSFSRLYSELERGSEARVALAWKQANALFDQALLATSNDSNPTSTRALYERAAILFGECCEYSAPSKARLSFVRNRFWNQGDPHMRLRDAQEQGRLCAVRAKLLALTRGVRRLADEDALERTVALEAVDSLKSLAREVDPEAGALDFRAEVAGEICFIYGLVDGCRALQEAHARQCLALAAQCHPRTFLEQAWWCHCRDVVAANDARRLAQRERRDGTDKARVKASLAPQLKALNELANLGVAKFLEGIYQRYGEQGEKPFSQHHHQETRSRSTRVAIQRALVKWHPDRAGPFDADPARYVLHEEITKHLNDFYLGLAKSS